MTASLAFLPGPIAAKERGDTVARALAAAGGAARLSRVRAISWIGTMRTRLGGIAVDLATEARIEPFMRARFESWLPADGRATRRTIMIERDGGFLVHNGAQTALPPDQVRFQREQAALYAYLLLAPAYLSPLGAARLNATRDGFPAATLTLARDGRIASADYSLPNPEGGAMMRQQFRLAGTVSAEGIRFPRSIATVQSGRLVSRLLLTDFSVELDAA